jgi:Dictyostelium (slime mold) repeat
VKVHRIIVLAAGLVTIAGCPLEPFELAGCRPDTCNDGNPCTDDLCDETSGSCAFVPIVAGTDCSTDGDVCDGIETCDTAGACVAGDPVDADDGDVCTQDSCEPVTGFVSHAPIAGCAVVEAGWQALPTVGAPSPRVLHGMVWTGSEVIVWGGKVTGLPSEVNDGARYDPTTDSWSSMSVVDAPSPRHSHSVVWTGSEMIVWGGFGEGGYRTDGARYDPVSDSWTPITNVGAPQGRTFHASLWIDDALFVWGGLQNTTVLGDGGRYEPANDSWSAVAAAGAPGIRLGPAAVWTGSEVMLWGGGNTFDWLDDGAFFDATASTWSATPDVDAPRFREQASAVWTGDQAVVWGGWDGANYLKDGALLTPGDGQWQAMTDVNAPNPRAAHLTLWTGTEMFVWGGCLGQACTTYQGDGGLWAPAGDGGVWKPVLATDELAPRRDPRGVWTGDQVVIWGGRNDSGNLGDGARAFLDGLDR